ncbi:Rv3235 family protein [Saccharothrix sp. NRRL B-16314]|uniref:Rv3235 family protein n=1 Tax=Saccharothrix sp. NRRL B-16314 TaxID=1463825 RepID=UPI00052521CA|nr:Rv3235 family protein [Saccharothrix sp. NRRL B-16314]
MPPQLRTLSSTGPAKHRHPTAEPSPPFSGPLAAAPALDPRRFLFPLIEALNGRRPPGQLSATFAPDALTTLTGVTARTHARLGRYRLCHVSADAAELAGTLHMPTKVRAFAARVERRNSRWHCTEFHLLP